MAAAHLVSVAGAAGDDGAAPVLRARGFTKRYGAVTAVDALDLTVGRGEIFGLIGPDGAGKSSLMKAAAGVLAFEGGQLEVFGVALDSERACERIKARIGLMPQGLGQNLYPDLSVEENIDFFARLRLVAPDVLAARKAELLAATRLEAFRARPMKQLSGGMKQKLGLVCTLIHAPELVILDEPTTGVDPVSRRDFWAILGRLLVERGITALVSTAYMDEAARFQRVALLFGGRLLACDAPERIAPLAPGCLVTVPDAQAALPAVRARFAQIDVFGPTLRVFVDDADAAQALGQVAACVPGLAPAALQASMRGQVVSVRSPDARRAMELLRPLPFVRRATLFGDTLHVVVTEDGASRDRIAATLRDGGVPASDIEEIEASLEDVFIERVADQAPAGSAS